MKTEYSITLRPRSLRSRLKEYFRFVKRIVFGLKIRFCFGNHLLIRAKISLFGATFWDLQKSSGTQIWRITAWGLGEQFEAQLVRFHHLCHWLVPRCVGLGERQLISWPCEIFLIAIFNKYYSSGIPKYQGHNFVSRLYPSFIYCHISLECQLSPTILIVGRKKSIFITKWF